MKKILFAAMLFLSVASYGQRRLVNPNSRTYDVNEFGIDSLSKLVSNGNVIIKGKTSVDTAGTLRDIRKAVGDPTSVDIVPLTNVTSYDYILTPARIKKLGTSDFAYLTIVVKLNGVEIHPYAEERSKDKSNPDSIHFEFGNTAISPVVIVTPGVGHAAAAPVDLTAYSTTAVANTLYKLAGYVPAWTDITGNPVTSQKIANWDAAFGWGNHANAGYATYGGTGYFAQQQNFFKQIINSFSLYPTTLSQANGLLFPGIQSYSQIRIREQADASILLSFQIGPNPIGSTAGRKTGFAFDRDVSGDGTMAVANQYKHQLLVTADSLYYSPDLISKYDLIHAGNISKYNNNVGGLYTASVAAGTVTSITFPHNLSGVTSNSVPIAQAHEAASADLLSYKHYVTCDATSVTITFPTSPSVPNGSNPVFNVQILKK